jgi:hypothetical protein
MADRQSNTHQYRQSLITGFRGKTFTRRIYCPQFGSGKMKEIIRTRTPFTDWDITPNNKRYGIKQVLDMDSNNIHVLVRTEESLSVPNPWIYRWDKYTGSTKKDSIYYSFESELATGDLPWEGTAYNSEGTLLSKYLVQGYRETDGTHQHRIDQLDMTRERGGLTLKTELINFANTHNLTLPDHDIDDSKIFQVSVNYKEDSPVSITYFTYEYKATV